jgi:hypothetical protein
MATVERPQRMSAPVPPGALLKRLAGIVQRRFPRQVEDARDPEYLAHVRQCPCLKCGVEPTEAAHVRMSSGLHNKRGGLGIKPADRWTLPLCSGCQLARQRQPASHRRDRVLAPARNQSTADLRTSLRPAWRPRRYAGRHHHRNLTKGAETMMHNASDPDILIRTEDRNHRKALVAANDAFVALLLKQIKRGKEKVELGTRTDASACTTRRIQPEPIFSGAGSPAAMCAEKGDGGNRELASYV